MQKKRAVLIWLVLTQEILHKYTIHDHTGFERQGNYFHNGMDDSKLTVEKEEQSCDTPTLNPKLYK